MSLYINELASLIHIQEAILRIPIQKAQFPPNCIRQSYDYGLLSMDSWGLNWVFTQRPDRAFANHRFAASRPPLPAHMSNQGRRPIPLPEEYLNHEVISRLPSSPSLPELVPEPEPKLRGPRWAYLLHSWVAWLRFWPLKAWDFVWNSIVRLFTKPACVVVGFLENINWCTVFGLIVAYSVAKFLVPAFDEKVKYAPKPLYVLFTPATARASKSIHLMGYKPTAEES